MMLLKVALTVIVMGILRDVVVAVRVTDELYRLNWEFCMDGMEKELVLSQERRKRDLNYLRYYRGTE